MKSMILTSVSLLALLGPSAVNASGAVDLTWTPWLDRDNPSGEGDFEGLGDHQAAGNACENPVRIQCRTVTGHVPWRATDDTYYCDLRSGDEAAPGGVCRNAEQTTGDKYCEDYEVRFLCPSSELKEATEHMPAADPLRESGSWQPGSVASGIIDDHETVACFDVVEDDFHPLTIDGGCSTNEYSYRLSIVQVENGLPVSDTEVKVEASGEIGTVDMGAVFARLQEVEPGFSYRVTADVWGELKSFLGKGSPDDSYTEDIYVDHCLRPVYWYDGTLKDPWYDGANCYVCSRPSTESTHDN